MAAISFCFHQNISILLMFVNVSFENMKGNYLYTENNTKQFKYGHTTAVVRVLIDGGRIIAAMLGRTRADTSSYGR